MKMTCELMNGQTCVINIDIDDQIEDIDSVAQVSYDCSWQEYMEDRIQEIADECSREVESEHFQERARRNWEELHPPRPAEVGR